MRNGALFAEIDAANFEGFLKQLYVMLDCKYPKFFKMDTLSKLAFMGAELLLSEISENSSEHKRTALVFSNRSSSLETDRKHQEAISSHVEQYPSPAVFVYTLPNIGVGEVAIRHKLQTENAFFVFETFEPEFLQKYTVSLLNENKCDQVLCGWVEVDGNERHGFFYVVGRNGKWKHSAATIKNFFEHD